MFEIIYNFSLTSMWLTSWKLEILKKIMYCLKYDKIVHAPFCLSGPNCGLFCTLAIPLGVSKQNCFKNWIYYHHQVWRFLLSWSPLEELVSVTGHQEQGSAILNIQYQPEIIEKWPMKLKQIRQKQSWFSCL